MDTIGKKNEELEPGYVFAPYIITSSNVGVIVENKQITRIRKLNKIYKKDREIRDDIFSPSKSVSSRYAKKIVNNNFYGVLTIK
jgi:hypothetical protein